jgi:hypothetical protein
VARHLGAVHAGHGEIDQHQIDVAFAIEHVQRGAAPRRAFFQNNGLGIPCAP